MSRNFTPSPNYTTTVYQLPKHFWSDCLLEAATGVNTNKLASQYLGKVGPLRRKTVTSRRQTVSLEPVPQVPMHPYPHSEVRCTYEDVSGVGKSLSI